MTCGTLTVRVTSIVTVAGVRSRKLTIASSRKPSPFGLTVVRSLESPANGVEPFVTRKSKSCGASERRVAADAGATTTSAATAARARRRTAARYLPCPLLQLVRLAGQRAERRLQEIVHARCGEGPRQQPAELGRDDLRPGERGGDPRADATGARDELADRLAEVARLDGVLGAFLRRSGHEGLAQEARHLVARNRSRGLERSRSEHD